MGRARAPNNVPNYEYDTLQTTCKKYSYLLLDERRTRMFTHEGGRAGVPLEIGKVPDAGRFTDIF